MEELKYPIGRFQYAGSSTSAERKERIEIIRELPFELGNAITSLNDAQLATPYRDGGWTVLQVVHHLTDASIVFYARTKRALTEDRPDFAGYDDLEWLKLADSALPPDSAMQLLGGLHVRWCAILDAMQPADFSRIYVHVERGEESMDYLIAYAAWHGRHHTAHITQLRKRMNW